MFNINKKMWEWVALMAGYWWDEEEEDDED